MDQRVVDLLKKKAGQGVEITILRSQPESRALEAANEKFFKQLEGVSRITIYHEPGVSHTKLLRVDKQYSIIGSANLSTASLEHHEEVSMMVSGDCPLQRQIAKQFEQILALSKRP